MNVIPGLPVKEKNIGSRLRALKSTMLRELLEPKAYKVIASEQ